MNLFSTAKLLIVGIVFFSSVVSATEIIHYKNMPITIHLTKGHERSIQFGDHIKTGITKGQEVKKLFRLQSAQGALHLFPYKVFDKQRIQVMRLTDSQVILIDLISVEATSETPAMTENIKIILESENTVEDQDSSEEVSGIAYSGTRTITPIDLTRHASQHLYGPTRLQSEVSGISEAMLGVKGHIRLFKEENRYKTVSRPVIAYQGGGYYLAAIYIKNKTADIVELNYLDINLPFSHVTYQHHQLLPSGTPGDSTILYLVSEVDLKNTLYPWTYFLDKKADAEEASRKPERKVRRSIRHAKK